MASESLKVWLNATEGMKLLEVSNTVFMKLVNSGQVRVRHLPGGTCRRYHRGDLEQIAQASISGASPQRSA